MTGRHAEVTPIRKPEMKARIDRIAEHTTGALDILDAIEAGDIKADNGRDSAQRAVVSKQYLYAAHLLDKARVLAMDEYHRYKGENVDLTGGNDEPRH